MRRCGVCDKIFDREDKMQAHQATHSRAGDGDYVRPYPCNFPGCGKAFTEKRNLNAHRRTQHTEVGRVSRGCTTMVERGARKAGVMRRTC